MKTEDWSDPSKIKEHQRLPGNYQNLGRGKVALLTPRLWTSSFLNGETIHFCCSQSPRL